MSSVLREREGKRESASLLHDHDLIIQEWIIHIQISRHDYCNINTLPTRAIVYQHATHTFIRAIPYAFFCDLTCVFNVDIVGLDLHFITVASYELLGLSMYLFLRVIQRLRLLLLCHQPVFTARTGPSSNPLHCSTVQPERAPTQTKYPACRPQVVR